MRLGDIQGAFVDRPAGDGADDARRLGGQQGLDVAEVMDTAGSDHRNLGGIGQRRGKAHVAALHHAVFGDVGINDGGHAVGFKALGQVDHLHGADLSPAVGGDETILGIQTNDHLARKRLAGVCHELRVFNRLGADDHVADAGLDVGLDGFQRADAAADLNRQLRVALGDRGDHFAVNRLAFEGAVQVDQMQTPATAIHPLGCHAHRVIGKHRGVVHAALAQAHAGAVFQIDSGNNQHRVNLFKSINGVTGQLFSSDHTSLSRLAKRSDSSACTSATALL